MNRNSYELTCGHPDPRMELLDIAENDDWKFDATQWEGLILYLGSLKIKFCPTCGQKQ